MRSFGQIATALQKPRSLTVGIKITSYITQLIGGAGMKVQCYPCYGRINTHEYAYSIREAYPSATGTIGSPRCTDAAGWAQIVLGASTFAAVYSILNLTPIVIDMNKGTRS